MATSVKLDDDLKSRIQHLAEVRHRSSHWIMREAIRDYVEREEKRESFKEDKRVFGLVIDFGTSQSPKSTRPLTTYLCPSRPGHQALRNNFASSLLLRTWLPMTGRRVRRPTLFSLWRKARRENSAASRLLGSTSLRFALHGWQRALRAWEAYQENGLHLTLEEADAWLAKLEAGEDAELPKCHI